jgi:hypothetical protein
MVPKLVVPTGGGSGVVLAAGSNGASECRAAGAPEGSEAAGPVAKG